MNLKMTTRRPGATQQDQISKVVRPAFAAINNVVNRKILALKISTTESTSLIISLVDGEASGLRDLLASPHD